MTKVVRLRNAYETTEQILERIAGEEPDRVIILSRHDSDEVWSLDVTATVEHQDYATAAVGMLAYAIEDAQEIYAEAEE